MQGKGGKKLEKNKGHPLDDSKFPTLGFQPPNKENFPTLGFQPPNKENFPQPAKYLLQDCSPQNIKKY